MICALAEGPDREETPMPIAHRIPMMAAAALALACSTGLAAAFDPTSKEQAWTAFVGRFQKRHAKEPDAFAAYAYDGTRILLSAIRTAG